MIEKEYFSWRSITELIRHITIVFAVAFLVAVLAFNHSASELILRAFYPTNISNRFCCLLVISFPAYLIILLIDSIDDVIVWRKHGVHVNLLRSIIERFFTT